MLLYTSLQDSWQSLEIRLKNSPGSRQLASKFQNINISDIGIPSLIFFFYYFSNRKAKTPKPKMVFKSLLSIAKYFYLFKQYFALRTVLPGTSELPNREEDNLLLTLMSSALPQSAVLWLSSSDIIALSQWAWLRNQGEEPIIKVL